ncbi:hypothetical protein NEOLEDRAFT_1176881 [Neolentinus lepideus HHB14362 ss-1]|uniref:DUF5745 domain-containing protein n=1 Tax=Neolentinus lepideus HHB14362 ss-1 TaxID=1314782 RepID=A0A165U128_9AGAM|nr:hypothetical protein NEOLEDRAFT_1176881 [Neolentinus lepideus HHB14362 ss-1]
MNGTAQSVSAEGDLVAALNDLLVSLDLLFTLESPDDLIPSLLVAILESILRCRLPVSANIRESRTLFDKIQAMKIFLGVLENDVIGSDVGLSDMDPRRLAVGEHEELVFVGELLCWVGSKHGLVEVSGSAHDHPDANVPPLHFTNSEVQDEAHSLSTHSTIMGSPNTTYSFQAGNAQSTSDTTFVTMSASPTNTQATRLDGRNSADSSKPPPMCIHEVEEPSSVAEFVGRLRQDSKDNTRSDSVLAGESSTSYCDCSYDESGIAGYPQAAPIRHTGLLDEVDNDIELKSFESAKLENGSSTRRVGRDAVRRPSLARAYSTATRYHTPNQHRLALMNERALLLNDLASLKSIEGSSWIR